MTSPRISRRRFLTQSAGAAALAALGPNLLLRGQDAASRRLNIAVIGSLGKGESDTKNIALQHNVVALVDVDSKRVEEAAKKHAKTYADAGKPEPQAPKLYQDFRKMFDEMSNGIDAVIVSTPDHAHFVAAMWAVKHKKHVCVQKPMTNTIAEARMLHKAAKEAGVITQMGNQGRTMEGQRQVKEWIEQGAIGQLKEIRLWTNRPIWPQGPMVKYPAEAPSNLNWDLWLAQEANEPYFEYEMKGLEGKGRKSVHPFNWRGWWQFGAGALGDMGCHVMDATFNLLGRRIPEKIEVQSSEVTDLTAPLWTNLVYHFAASDKYPALKVSWNDGRKDDGTPNKPERDERIPEDLFNKASSGMIFIGTEGVIMDKDAYCGNPQIFPQERAEEIKKATEEGRFKKTEKRSTHPGNPQLEWANAIVTNGETSSTFDYSAPLTEFVLLGNLAVRSGKTIQWDAKAMKVTNDAASNRFVSRPAYRKGWTV